MGQFMNDARLARLNERTEVLFEWCPVDEFARERGVDLSSLTGSGINLDTSGAAISSFMTLPDLFGESLLMLEATTPRRISALGAQTTNAAMLFLVMAGVIVTVVIWYLLRGTILQPIGKLAQHMKKIRQSGDLSHRLQLESNDEIGALATEFGNLTSEVHEARKALLFQSFKAGKADTAAEVLHNIRNAMTPMINGLERLAGSFKVADDLRVEEATSQIADPDCPPDRASKFLQYIQASFNRVKAVNEKAADEMRVVSSQARQVEAILSDQEKFASAPPVEENIVVDEVVGEAAHVIPKDAQDQLNVDIDDGLTRFRVRAHRIGLLQVLGNLFLNAYESIQRENRQQGQISLSASEAVVDDKPMVRLTVRDNGTGFDKEASQRIFQRGFSSKSEGSATGLGLHWCANAVAGMGGRIIAESQGSGKGAEFHVLLPAAQGG
jgi:signal transduction histidine kinase